MLYKGLRTKKIKKNGRRTTGDDRLVAGDEITLYLPDDFFTPRKEEVKLHTPPDLEVVFENEHVLLVNKQAGILVHTGDEGEKDEITLIDRIKAYLYQKGDYRPQEEHSFAPALCNRIDRNTAGIVICAKTAAALREINELIRNNQVKKQYAALIRGIPEKKEGTLIHILEKDPKSRTMQVKNIKNPDARTAITRYRILKSNYEKNISLVEITLETGRTHQIRAQFSHIGHPLVGDGKYGRLHKDISVPGFPRQALCAYKVTFLPTDQKSVLYPLQGRELSIRNPFRDMV
ncbi:MAG TPA: RluA family pseudouridine synthase [Clostridiales bacterium]|jgi:23S rRNA pseudouridine955/2504/2580 synthase|nr:RluA family pseudouridine synthase [Clostridiales bacterium]